MMGIGFFLLMLTLGRVAIASDARCALTKNEERIWGVIALAGMSCMIFSGAVWLYRVMP